MELTIFSCRTFGDEGLVIRLVTAQVKVRISVVSIQGSMTLRTEWTGLLRPSRDSFCDTRTGKIRVDDVCPGSVAGWKSLQVRYFFTVLSVSVPSGPQVRVFLVFVSTLVCGESLCRGLSVSRETLEGTKRVILFRFVFVDKTQKITK